MGAALLLLLTVAVETPPPAESERIPLLALDLERNGVGEQETKVINSLIVQALSRHEKLRVLSSADIRQLADLAAEQQSMGCDTSSCLAEIAGAMGASYVVYGQVGKLGDVVLVQLNLFDSEKGVAVAREKVETTELGALARLIEPAIDRLVVELVGAPPAPAPIAAESEVAEPASGAVLPWVVAGAGVVVTVGGGIAAAFGLEPLLRHSGAASDVAALRDQGTAESLAAAREPHARATSADADWRAWGVWAVVGGAVGVSLGAALTTAGVVWATLPPEDE